MIFSRITLIAALVTGTFLSACGHTDDGAASVRHGPQAVHPSRSALAASGLSYGGQAHAGTVVY